MKKIISLALALILTLSLATTAFAAMEGELTGGSITINDAVNGQTYNAYQILVLESHDGDKATYKANTAWKTWLEGQTAYVAFDAQGYVTWIANKEPATVAAFAKLAQVQVQAASMSADATATASGTTVTLDNLKLGYYLVDTTLGTLCSLDTTNPIVEMSEKNEAPTITKVVQEDSDSAWGATNTAEFGDAVNFKITINAHPGAQNYVLHDNLPDGMTLVADSIAIAGLTVDNDYTVKTTGLTDGCDFEIEFKQTYLDTITEDTSITVAYSATLDNDAAVDGTGNENTAKLTYGDDEAKNTVEASTTTYTYKVSVLKYANGVETTVLPGVKFVLLNGDTKGEAEVKVATVDGDKLTGWENVPGEGQTWPAGTTLTTDANGKIEINGLDAGTYYLREIEALPGYNKLAADQVVNVTDENLEVKINNQSGAELPSTGGMGTTLFYVLGGLMSVGAMVLLVTKKRMSV